MMIRNLHFDIIFQPASTDEQLAINLNIGTRNFEVKCTEMRFAAGIRLDLLEELKHSRSFRRKGTKEARAASQRGVWDKRKGRRKGEGKKEGGCPV